MKTKIKKILYRFLQDGISSDEATQQILDLLEDVGQREHLESGLTCMMCRKPKNNDWHGCCEECAGVAF